MKRIRDEQPKANKVKKITWTQNVDTKAMRVEVESTPNTPEDLFETLANIFKPKL